MMSFFFPRPSQKLVTRRRTAILTCVCISKSCEHLRSKLLIITVTRWISNPPLIFFRTRSGLKSERRKWRNAEDTTSMISTLIYGTRLLTSIQVSSGESFNHFNTPGHTLERAIRDVYIVETLDMEVQFTRFDLLTQPPRHLNTNDSKSYLASADLKGR
jgi:hypothetical protein